MITSKSVDNAGHRDRLRKRILADGGSMMADYELLEFLLTAVIPRRDVKPIAKDLLRRFGTFAEVIYAPENKLLEIPWVKENSVALFKGIAVAVQRICWQNLANEKTQILGDTETLVDYFRSVCAYAEVEELHIIYLDAAFKPIGTEILQKGSLTSVSITAREVIRQALDKKACSIALAHNHPSGEVKPSRKDIEFTAKIEAACNTMNIALQEHIIVSKNNYYSFRENGLLHF